VRAVSKRLVVGMALVLLGLMAMVPAAVARAEANPQNPPGLRLDIRPGFGGYIESSEWNPIFITASNDGPDLRGEIVLDVAGLGGTAARYSRAIDLPQGSRKQITLYVSDIPSFTSELTIQLLRNNRTLISEVVPVQVVPHTALLIGLWSDTPGVLSPVAGVRPSSGITHIARLTVDDLPGTGEGWTALDALLVYNVDSGQLGFEQREALRDWVAGGGHLIVAGGPAYQRTLAGLTDLVPFDARDSRQVDLGPLVRYTGVPFETQTVQEALVTTGVLTGNASVLVSAGETPLVVARELGQGRVTFISADPGLEPLASWNGIDELWRAVMVNPESRPGWSYGFSEQWESARQAVAAIPGVSLPSVLQLCGFLALYVLLIGPINYLTLWRLKRRELAWVTIPALVVLFALLAYVTGFSLRGSRIIVHRLAVVQSWSGDEAARVDGLVGIWSPRRARYDVELAPGFMARPVPRELGGTFVAAGGSMTVEQGTAVTVRDVRVDVGSIQPFVVEGFTHNAPRIEGDLRLEPVPTGIRATGDVINFSDVDLTNVSILLAGGAQLLGDLPAGEVLAVDTILYNAYSLPATNALDPYPLSPVVNLGYVDVPMAAELAGQQDCFRYNYDTAPDLRRCNLATAILVSDAPGRGVYLAGWSNKALLDTRVLNAGADIVDLTLHIVELRAEVAATSATLAEIPPGLTTWRVLERSNGVYDARPYNLYMDTDQAVIFRFEPFLPVTSQYRGAIVHLDMYSYDFADLGALSIWDYQAQRWVDLEVEIGDISVLGSQYVDEAGGVNLRITSDPDGYGITVNRLDVTLLTGD